MNNLYEYGPNFDFDVSFEGDMKRYYGSYESQNENNKYLIQSLCHAIYEIKDDIQRSENGMLWFHDKNWIHWTHSYEGDRYSLYTYDYMTAFSIIQTGTYSFKIDFVSTNQLIKCDSFLDYAVNHKASKVNNTSNNDSIIQELDSIIARANEISKKY